MKEIAVIFDFDATLIGDEGLEDMDSFVLEAINASRNRKEEITMEEIHKSNSSLDLVKKWVTPEMVDSVYDRIIKNNVRSMHNAVRDEAMLKTLVEMRSCCKLCVFSGREAKSLESGLRQLGLYGLFDMIIPDTENFLSKPNPEAILYIASHYGIPLDRCVYVGDKTVDYDTTQHAGCRFVGAAWYRGTRGLAGVPGNLICFNIQDLSDKIMHPSS